MGILAAHSAYEKFSWCECIIVSLLFSHLGFWSGNLFLFAPFPNFCILVLFISLRQISGAIYTDPLFVTSGGSSLCRKVFINKLRFVLSYMCNDGRCSQISYSLTQDWFRKQSQQR